MEVFDSTNEGQEKFNYSFHGRTFVQITNDVYVIGCDIGAMMSVDSVIFPFRSSSHFAWS